MHFLKCSNCGHFNDLKTEYLIFCSKCNKKLDNNYLDWSRQNRDKSFDDFKQLICSTEITEAPKVKSAKPGRLKYWIGFAIAFAIFYAIGEIGGVKLAGLIKKPAFDKIMMESASEINKTCPVMIDNATRLDNAIALPDNVFQYNYTLVKMVKDSIKVNDLKNYLEPTVRNFVRTNPAMKTIRDQKTTVNYYYKDKAGVYLFTISINPEQYE